MFTKVNTARTGRVVNGKEMMVPYYAGVIRNGEVFRPSSRWFACGTQMPRRKSFAQDADGGRSIAEWTGKCKRHGRKVAAGKSDRPGNAAICMRCLTLEDDSRGRSDRRRDGDDGRHDCKRLYLKTKLTENGKNILARF